MSKNISYSNNNNISSTQEYSSNNPLAVFFNTSKIYNYNNDKKIKIFSLDSTPNLINKKKIQNYNKIINNTFSNEKTKKINNIPLSNSSKSSRRCLSVSQGNKTKTNYISYLNPKNNKYLGINLNLVSNSSHRKNETNKSYFRDKINIKTIINNNDYRNKDKKHVENNENIEINNNNVLKKNNIKNIKKLETQSILNESANTKISKNTKKNELNSSQSHAKQSSLLENASVNQSTPVSSFHPYEADSSPTNYIINNNLNQSQFTYLNNSNKISEKEDEKRIGEKLDKINKLRKNKKNKKKISNNNIDGLDIINISNSENENHTQNTIEEKEEEYLNSMNSKFLKTKDNINNLQETIIKKTEESKIEDKIEKIVELEEDIKENQIYKINKEKRDKLLEIKKKNEEIKNSYEKEKEKEKNMISTYNKISYNKPKSTYNTKLNFNYFLESKKEEKEEKKEKENIIQNKSYIINPINFINLRQSEDKKQENSYFFNYGSSAIIDTGIFVSPLINNIYGNNKNKIEKQNFTIKKEKLTDKINNPEKQSQFEIKAEKIENKKIFNNTFTSFNFAINNNKDNNKRSYLKKNIKKNLINDIIHSKDNEIQIINSINNNNNISEKTETKDASTQFFEEIKDNKNKKNNLFYRNYIKSLSNNNTLKTEFKNQFLDNSNKVIIDFDEINKKNKTINFYNNKVFNTTYNQTLNLMNKIPHHQKTRRNSNSIWNDFSSNIKKNNEQNNLFNGTSIFNKNNKFNRKRNTFVYPANPFDSINKAREYFFFNN